MSIDHLPSVFYRAFGVRRLQVIEVIRHPEDKAESKYNPDAGISKEDEERYQKLLCENDELQRLIVQVSSSTFLWALPSGIDRPGKSEKLNEIHSHFFFVGEVESTTHHSTPKTNTNFVFFVFFFILSFLFFIRILISTHHHAQPIPTMAN